MGKGSVFQILYRRPGGSLGTQSNYRGCSTSDRSTHPGYFAWRVRYEEHNPAVQQSSKPARTSRMIPNPAIAPNCRNRSRHKQRGIFDPRQHKAQATEEGGLFLRVLSNMTSSDCYFGGGGGGGGCELSCAPPCVP